MKQEQKKKKKEKNERIMEGKRRIKRAQQRAICFDFFRLSRVWKEIKDNKENERLCLREQFNWNKSSDKY